MDVEEKFLFGTLCNMWSKEGKERKLCRSWTERESSFEVKLRELLVREMEGGGVETINGSFQKLKHKEACIHQ